AGAEGEPVLGDGEAGVGVRRHVPLDPEDGPDPREFVEDEEAVAAPVGLELHRLEEEDGTTAADELEQPDLVARHRLRPADALPSLALRPPDRDAQALRIRPLLELALDDDRLLLRAAADVAAQL